MTTLARAATGGNNAWRLWALVPLLLLVAVVALFSAAGSSVTELLGRTPPPADEFEIRRVEFKPGEIRIRVTNPQPEDLTIAFVTVDDAIMPYTLDGPATLERLRSSTIVVPFDWVEDEPIAVGVTSSTGIQTTEEIAAAVETPEPDAAGVLGYTLIGALVGIVPVALGLLWLPSLRRARPEWLAAFMALTGGMLTFLALDALSEAFALQATLPSALGGAGLVLLGVAVSYLTLTFISRRFSGEGSTATGLTLALLVAIGIGLHNFGEGLAIGQAGAAGEVSLALALIVGFGLHNATEGFGIVGPISGDGVRPSWSFLALLGLIGGGPTFIGTVVGQAWVSEAMTVAFMAVAAGSILYVVQELLNVNRRFGFPVLVAWMLLLGLALGFGTDFVLEAAEIAG
jgi:zinc transporter, ZIP family